MNNIKMAGPSITELEKKTVMEMMENGWDSYEYVERFEHEFAAWHNRKFCLMTPCCTHAIHLILLTLDIKKGDEIIVPECSWTATAAPITYQNAVPVFSDINRDNWCMCPQSVEKKITEKTKAIIVVDLYGNMPDMEKLSLISKKYNIPLIEDAAEALGSIYKGTRAGKFGIAGVHSFHRTKTMTTGEGGALLIDDKKLYERAKFLRDHGRSNTIPYFTIEATPKYMPSNYQAALAVAQFTRIKELVDRKRYIFHRYKRNLGNLNSLQLNMENASIYNGVWATSVVFDKSLDLKKDEIIQRLSKINIPARPFFYPLSSLPAYKKFNTGSRRDNPVAYDVSERGITLACHFDLSDEQIDSICEGIKNIL